MPKLKQHKAKVNLMFPGTLKTPMISKDIVFTSKELSKGEDYVMAKAAKELAKNLNLIVIFEESIAI